MTTTAAPARWTAEERRESILEAALVEFAVGGLHGTSTDAIAKRAGISQPYLFRLFATKKELFMAAVERGFSRMAETMDAAAIGLHDEEALHAMGDAYGALLTGDRSLLLVQMHAFAACDDADVCAVVRRGFGDLVRMCERRSGKPANELAQFVAFGMLFNVIAAMSLLDCSEGWASDLVAGCGGKR